MATKKIRTLTQLAEEIDAELGWRKRELSYLRTSIGKATSFSQTTLIRAAIALLYAHWEGFVVACLRTYVSYVTQQKEPLHRLVPAVRVGAMLAPIKRIEREKGAAARASFLIVYEKALAGHADLRGDRLVDAESNLNAERFLGLLACVGLDTTRFEPASKFLDESLLARRNAICHGESVDLDVAAYGAVEGDVIDLMEQVKNEALDVAHNRKFLVSSP